MTGAEAAIRLREGRPEDLEQIVRIENLCFDDPWSAAALAGELVSDNLRLSLVALAGEDLCGYLMAWRVVDQLHLLNLAVDPGWRRKGVAGRLLAAAATRGLDSGLSEITLEVRRGNLGALAFYRVRGFAETSVRPGYYQDDGEDAIILTRALAGLQED